VLGKLVAGEFQDPWRAPCLSRTSRDAPYSAFGCSCLSRIIYGHKWMVAVAAHVHHHCLFTGFHGVVVASVELLLRQ
jgi:hypothetical protein